MGADVDEHRVRLEHRDGKWSVAVLRGAGDVWVTLGGCSCQWTALRLWLAVVAQDARP
jgi:hypothetical protein